MIGRRCKYKSIWESIPSNEKMIISQGIRQRNVMEGMQMERMTIDEWLNKIKGENK